MIPKQCRDCGEFIIYKKTAKGKYMPCDRERVSFTEIDRGGQQFMTESGRMMRGMPDPGGEQVGYVPHFGTCKARLYTETKKTKAIAPAQNAAQTSESVYEQLTL